MTETWSLPPKRATCRAILLSAIVLAAAGPAQGAPVSGATASLGGGTVGTFATFAEDGAPTAIGVRFDAAALDGLPEEPNTTSRCFDMDGDGAIGAGECLGDYELRLPLPAEAAGRDDFPFKWAMINWNPRAHMPPAWGLPHFDLHFMIAPEAEIDAIRTGPCGEHIHCDDFERARMPVEARYIHPDHINVDGAVAMMGNHLIDRATPELQEGGPVFTHTYIYGSFDGRLIFQEVMLTRDHLLSNGSACTPIKQPEAWQTAGWYPTSYCIRTDPATGTHEVTLEDFVLREAG